MLGTELFKIVNTPCETHEDIDDVLRSYLAFTSQFKRREHTNSPTMGKSTADESKRIT